MLEPWIIEQIRRREEEERRREQPQIPLYDEPPQERPPERHPEEPQEKRGVVIIGPDGEESPI